MKACMSAQREDLMTRRKLGWHHAADDLTTLTEDDTLGTTQRSLTPQKYKGIGI